MLIIGAKGFAKELLEVFYQNNLHESVCFFDDHDKNIPSLLFDRFRVIKSIQEAEIFFSTQSRKFALGIGGPMSRRRLSEIFVGIGGELTSVISPFSNIGHFETVVEVGCSIMTGTVITNSVHVGRGSLLNLNCTIGHDTTIGSFCELNPGVHVSGHVHIGKNCSIGTGAVILPKIKIGDNAVIGAGAVVTKDVESNVTVAGVPAKIIKHHA